MHDPRACRAESSALLRMAIASAADRTAHNANMITGAGREKKDERAFQVIRSPVLMHMIADRVGTARSGSLETHDWRNRLGGSAHLLNAETMEATKASNDRWSIAEVTSQAQAHGTSLSHRRDDRCCRWRPTDELPRSGAIANYTRQKSFNSGIISLRISTRPRLGRACVRRVSASKTNPFVTAVPHHRIHSLDVKLLQIFPSVLRQGAVAPANKA